MLKIKQYVFKFKNDRKIYSNIWDMVVENYRIFELNNRENTQKI